MPDLYLKSKFSTKQILPRRLLLGHWVFELSFLFRSNRPLFRLVAGLNPEP